MEATHLFKFEGITLVGNADETSSQIIVRNCQPMCSEIYERISKLFIEHKPFEAELITSEGIVARPLAVIKSLHGNTKYGFELLDRKTLLPIGWKN